MMNRIRNAWKALTAPTSPTMSIHIESPVDAETLYKAVAGRRRIASHNV